MRRFFIWLLAKLSGVPKQNLLQAPTPARLDGLEVGVYVRQPNGSRTSFEKIITQRLLSMGATIRPVSQRSAFKLVHEGEVVDVEQDILLTGTLVVSEEHRQLNESERYAASFLPIDKRPRYVPIATVQFEFQAWGRECDVLFSGIAITHWDYSDGDLNVNKKFDELSDQVVEALEDAKSWKKILLRVSESAA